MADISKVVLPNNSEYDIKDTTARSMPSAYYGTCATAAATAAKVVTISADQNFVLSAGAVIGVRYTYTNSASSVTLNVNSTGAKSIRYNTSAYTGSDSGVCGYANRTIFYMYDGTYWVHLSYGYNTNGNTVPTAYSTTAAGTAAKTATCTNYNLLAKSYTILLISTTNTAASALTLNINSKGAKPIYINGSASSASNYTMPAGSYLVYYDGTNYYIRTDGKITGDITGDAATVNGKTVGVNVPADAKFDGLYARLIGDINIPANSDLNTYVTPGEYKCHLNDTAATITNSPTTAAFRLRVEYTTHDDSRYLRQLLTPFSHRFPYIRVSTDSGSTWNDWIREGTESNIGMVKLSDTYSSAVSGANVNGYTAATQNALYNVYNYATGKANSSSPNLKFRVGTNSDTADDNPHVELRESGTLGTARRLSLIYYDANGETTSTSLVNENGAFLPAFPPKSHASSTASTYGQGNASNYGHVKLSDTYTSAVSGANAAGGVAASQNALYNAYSSILEILNGTKYSISGDKVLHTRSTNTDVFTFNSYSNNSAIQINTEKGCIALAPMGSGSTRYLAVGVSQTWSFTQLYVCGFITASQKQIRFSLPCFVNPKATKATPGQISVVIRHIGGGYPYMCYGSSNNQYVQLGSDAIQIWNGSSSSYTNGVSSINTSIYNGYINMNINFVNTLRTNAGTTVVTNNVPISVLISGALTME